MESINSGRGKVGCRCPASRGPALVALPEVLDQPLPKFKRRAVFKTHHCSVVCPEGGSQLSLRMHGIHDALLRPCLEMKLVRCRGREVPSLWLAGLLKYCLHLHGCAGTAM